MSNLKVIIIGAGIGGLAAGIGLKKAGFEVEMYDRVKELRPVGAGISLWSNGVKVLNSLGLSEQIAQIGGRMERMQYRWKTGELLNDITLSPLVEAVGQCPYPVARADLQNMLAEHFPGEIHLEHKCVGVEQDETGVTVTFENGHQAKGDLLIASDGIRSTLRDYVLGEKVEPQYRGYVNWNGLVPCSEDLAPANSWVIYVGDHKRASLMPVGGDRFYFFFDVPMPKGSIADSERYRAELAAHFQGWAEPVQRLIQRLDPSRMARPEIHDVGPLKQIVRGRVALLGDAAHTTCPDLGQGGCQALEDAWVITKHLTTENLNLDYALMRYERDRLERANPVVEKARNRAEVIHGKDPEITKQWYEQLSQEDPIAVTSAISKVILAGPLR